MSNNKFTPQFSPIAIFAFNRPLHTKKMIEKLRMNQEFALSEVYIFIDGPRNYRDLEDIREVNKLFIQLGKTHNLTIELSNKNRGIEKSITYGVTKILKKHSCVIVLEDDILVSKYFLDYMNNALKLYENNNKVASIHGYIYPIKTEGLPQTFFLRGADCWGWATWSRAWQYYSDDAKELRKKILEISRESDFNFNDRGPYWEMLDQSIRGEVDSWAIKWYASAFVEDMYTLYPKYSLVQNIGNDDSGKHSRKNSIFDQDILQEKIYLQNEIVQDNVRARIEFEKFFRKNYKKTRLINWRLKNVK